MTFMTPPLNQLYSVSDAGSLHESFLPVFNCQPDKVPKVTLLLSAEGIPCLIEATEEFQFAYQLDTGKAIREKTDLTVKVPALQLEKARAVLDWETSLDIELEPGKAFPGSPDEWESCPACEANLPMGLDSCSECEVDLLPEETVDSAVDDYSCSACGTDCDSEATACPFCGARLDN